MKQYVLDELRLEDFEQIRNYLDETYGPAKLGGLYWVPIQDPALLTPIQAEHTQCRPYYFVIELEESKLSAELLVRAQQTIRCNCIAYANEKQRNWLYQVLEDMLTTLALKI